MKMSKHTVLAAVAAAFTCLTFNNGAQASTIDPGAFAYRASFTVSGYTGAEVLENFPVLVRLSATSPSGFDYADCASDGSDMRFADDAGNLIPHEIDTWDTAGESLVWVKLPKLGAGTTFSMWYGGTAAAGDTTGTWSAYTGVWHMDEASGSVADATGHGLTASPQGNTANSIAVEGAVGNGRQTATSAAKGYLSVPNYDSFNLGDTFTMSGWVKMTGCTQYPRVFSRKANYTDANGWEVEMNSGSMANFSARGANNPTYSGTFNPALNTAWSHIALVYNGTTLTVYQNGAQVKTGEITAATDNGLALSFGCDSDGSETHLQGAFDECRLRGGAASADWVKAEYDTASSASFLTAGASQPTPNPNPSFSVSVTGLGADGFVAAAAIRTVGQGASSCDLYLAYGPSADPLPAYERVATGLVAGGTFSHNVTGLQEDVGYTCSFLVSNNLGRTASRTGTVTTGIDFERPDPSVAEFSRGVKFTVAGYTGTEELTNFPVLVRLSQGSPTGFSYADFYNPGDVPGADMCFLDAEGNAIPHEIDTWNTSGESLVWVTLPRMTNGTEFAMWYRSSKSGAAIDGGANAWEDYTGVWHLGEGGDGAQYVYDSTTNALTGVTHANSLAVSSGRIGAARRNSTKSGDSAANGRILVSLGDADSRERAVVDAIVPEFSASLWFSPKDKADWSYLITRKGGDTLEGWGIQFGNNTDYQPVRIWASLGGNNDPYYRTINPGSPYNSQANMNQVAWRKVNIVYGSDGYVDYYYDGGAYHTRQQVPLCGKSFDNNLSEILARNGSADLSFGGMSASGYGSFNGEMDEVRLRKGKDSADWVKAEYDAVVDTAFLSGGAVVSLAETPRPIATLVLSDSGAKYAQFSGSIGLCGGEATACDVLVKVWKTAESEPASWTNLVSGIADGASFSCSYAGLDPETAYSYKLKAVNNLETPTDSEIAEGTFTTGGTGAGGTGGERYRIGNDYVHVFEIDPETGANTFEFTPPSYLSSVQALVVAGGGPGGYRRGGGGGAGGLIHNTALAVAGGETYTVTVGAGGVATESAAAYGTSGGASSISLGATTNALAIGGGAGGNYNASFYAGVAGGSGGGAAVSGNSPGAGTAGQGNAGGQANAYDRYTVSGGGGGAGRAGGGASGDNPPSGGSGGQGYRCAITGSDVWYAGGGGGGGVQAGKASNMGSPGGGGDGGGGRGGMAVPNGTVNPAFSEQAVAGTDGLGGGGGGGSDVNGAYKGANGGNGVVIVRYTVQGSGAGSAEPVVSLTGVTYAGDLKITGSWRVAWAGEGEDNANVYIKWGYAANSLTHSVKVAQDAVGTGSFEITVPVDQTTIYLCAMADNGNAQGLSDEIVPIYVPKYEGVVPGDPTIPVLGTVSLSTVDGLFVRVSGSVTSFGTAGAGEDPITGCEVYALVGTSANVSRMTAQDAMPVTAGEPFSLAISNLTANVTYYWCLEARNSAGVAIATEVGSFTTLERSLMGTATTAANQRTVSVSGTVTQVGAGTTTILVRWNDGGWSAWEPVATFAPGAASTAFSATHSASSWGNVSYEFMCSNECATAEGVPTGQAWTSTQSGTASPTDKAIYTWQPVDGDWNGAWNDSAHWSCSSDDGRGYPQSGAATASFANCTLANPVTVTVPTAHTIGTLTFFGDNPASLTFVGQGTSTSKILASTLQDLGAKDNSVLEFRDMTIGRASNDVWTPTKSSAGPTNFTFRLSGATLSNISELTIASPYATVEFLNGSTATFSIKMSIGGTNTVVTIDDSTVSAAAIFIPADADGPGMKVRLCGTAPLLKQNTTDGAFSCWAQSWPVVYEFRVPVGGYAAAPVQMASTTYRFGEAHAKDTSGATPTFSFAVAADSPALKNPGTISNNVLVQTASGFQIDRMADPLGTVPRNNGTVKYGVDGAETSDMDAARQILLYLTGRSPLTMILVW